MKNFHTMSSRCVYFWWSDCVGRTIARSKAPLVYIMADRQKDRSHLPAGGAFDVPCRADSAAERATTWAGTTQETSTQETQARRIGNLSFG